MRRSIVAMALVHAFFLVLVLVGLGRAAGPLVVASYVTAWGQPISPTATVVNATLWLQSPGATDFVSIGTFPPNVTTSPYTVTGHAGDGFCIKMTWTMSDVTTVTSVPTCATIAYTTVS